MSTQISYPVVLELRIKKNKFLTRTLVVTKDTISYYDKNDRTSLIFNTPVDDCEILEKWNSEKTSCELHLVSRNKYYLYLRK